MNKILLSPENDDILKKECQKVNFPLDAETIEDVAKLMETIQNTENAAGLAMPQIGINKQIFISYNQYSIPIIIYNPSYKRYIESDIISSIESCLSIPNKSYNIPRFNWIDVEYQDNKGTIHKRTLCNFDAIVFQHETDHLNGVLISDIGKEVLDKKYI